MVRPPPRGGFWGGGIALGGGLPGRRPGPYIIDMYICIVHTHIYIYTYVYIHIDTHIFFTT